MKKWIFRLSICILLVSLLTPTVSAAQLLIPGGEVIGLELTDETVTVAAFHEQLGKAAKESGLKVGDRITHVDSTAVKSAEDVSQALQHSGGTVTLSLLREGKPRKISLSPEITEKGPCLGIYLKQGITGIGTVTFYDPETGRFGVLGHGVNDSSGDLLDMVSGNAYEAGILSVKKGKVGTPGQLVGSLQAHNPVGTLSKNTVQGVFGKTKSGWSGEKLPIATWEDVRTGSATIRSDVQGKSVQEYSVEILKIYPSSKSGSRNMLIKITDPALLDITGGIVQGMSGSPIIQDGKLIGAVTHVLVNDPTTGYGIFIENMLDAAA
ncbi:MAG: PDZ domain-containing protein [Oscillospiraceae bacterium]|nr:PDZ domain-containing protein [Oscillospiraceae bacterium]